MLPTLGIEPEPSEMGKPFLYLGQRVNPTARIIMGGLPIRYVSTAIGIRCNYSFQVTNLSVVDITHTIDLSTGRSHLKRAPLCPLSTLQVQMTDEWSLILLGLGLGCSRHECGESIRD